MSAELEELRSEIFILKQFVEQTENNLNHTIQVITLRLQEVRGESTFQELVDQCVSLEENKCDVILHLVNESILIINEHEEGYEQLLDKYNTAKATAQREIDNRHEEEDLNTALRQQIAELEAKLRRQSGVTADRVALESLRSQNAILELNLEHTNKQIELDKKSTKKLLDRIKFMSEEKLRKDAQVCKLMDGNNKLEEIEYGLSRIIINYKKKPLAARLTRKYINSTILRNNIAWDQYLECCGIDHTSMRFIKNKEIFDNNKSFLQEQLLTIKEVSLADEIAEGDPIYEDLEHFYDLPSSEQIDMSKMGSTICDLVVAKVPLYDSEEGGSKRPELFPRFLVQAKAATKGLSADEETEFVQYLIKLKLQGSIYGWCVGKEFKTMQEFEDDVSEQFGESTSLDDLLSQIQIANQRIGENLKCFGNRLNQLVRKYKAGHMMKYPDDSVSFITSIGILAFSKGVRDHEVKIYLSTIRPVTLDEAIDKATKFREHATMISANEIHTQAETNIERCQRCNRVGHTALQCGGQNNNAVICQLCSKPGHIATECFQFKQQGNNFVNNDQNDGRFHSYNGNQYNHGNQFNHGNQYNHGNNRYQNRNNGYNNSNYNNRHNNSNREQPNEGNNNNQQNPFKKPEAVRQGTVACAFCNTDEHESLKCAKLINLVKESGNEQG